MKRRVISLITVLALCVSLCPVCAAADDTDPGPSSIWTVYENTTDNSTYELTTSQLFDTAGYSYTISGCTAIRVRGTGRLYLTTGTIESTKGAGIEVMDGGFLRVDDPDMTVIGTTYGLDISSGAQARLSGGTFTGKNGAVRAQDYAALLVTGYAYFDESGEPILPEDAAGETTLSVKKCTDHAYAYTPLSKRPEHSLTCNYCGTVDTDLCTFSFGAGNRAACTYCDHTIAVSVDEDSLGDLIYNGDLKPGSVRVDVVLDPDTPLEEPLDEDDYEVELSRAYVGEITVTVTINDYSEKFTKTYCVDRDEPVITWNSVAPVEVDYDGTPVDPTYDLPAVTITVRNGGDLEELEDLLYFSYKGENDAAFTERSLPTDAGNYEIRANLPETDNYKAVSSGPLYLTISKIDPFIDNKTPEALNLVYNGEYQKLVTEGAVWDGAVIEFSLDGGPYSDTVPTAVNAGKYKVEYTVTGSGNFDYTDAGGSIDITIEPKEITPDVELEYYTVVYDGGFKQPKVTVRDGDTVLPPDEYKVTYKNNQNVGTAVVIVSDEDDGNYTIVPPEGSGEPGGPDEPDEPAGPKDPEGVVVTFEITQKDQDGLNITGQPGVVTYGDVFILGTSGGSGDGAVTWEILPDKAGDGETDIPSAVAKVDAASGQITVIGCGAATVRATRSGTDYKKATAEWTFNARKKPVVATVTAEDKTYDGGINAEVHAVVDKSLLAFPGDEITIAVTGAFLNGDAGTGKDVAVNTAGATVSGTRWQNYDITYSAATVKANISKAETYITAPTAKEPQLLVYNRRELELIYDDAVAAPVNERLAGDEPLQVEYALSGDGIYSKALPTATDAGDYEVLCRVREGENFAASAAVRVSMTICRKEVTEPEIILDEDYSLVYDGSEKEPPVTVKDMEDEIAGEYKIPDSEYTVKYSNNVYVGENAAITIVNREGGNYIVSGGTTFEITTAHSAVLTKPQARSLTYNGEFQDLVTTGTASGGKLLYALAGSGGEAPTQYEDRIPQGKLAGEYTVYYMVDGDSYHEDAAVDSVTVTIQPKTVVNPVIIPEKTSDTYTGQPIQPGVMVKDGNTTIDRNEYDVGWSDNTNVGTATIRVTNKTGANYIINGSTTFEIRKAAAKFADDGKPQANTLEYNGNAQLLVTAGTTNDGSAAYSQDGINYSLNIPKGTDAGKYTVWFKVIGDSNHIDCAPESVSVTIAPKTVTNLNITCSPESFPYDGTAKTPDITVYDDGKEIPASEYTVVISRQPAAGTGSQPETRAASQPAIEVGAYNVTVTDKSESGGNYKFNQLSPLTFNIEQGSQAALSIVTDRSQTVHYGDSFELSTSGGSGSGRIVWKIDDAYKDIATIDNGVVTVGGVDTDDGFVVTAYKEGDGSYKQSDVASKTFLAAPKTVTPVITVEDKLYDGKTDAKLTASWRIGDLVSGDDVKVEVEGKFVSADAGTGKQVTDIKIKSVSGNDDNKYNIILPTAVTGNIYKAAAKITPPKPAENLVYNKEKLKLVTHTPASGDIGTVIYSLSQNGTYSTEIPSAVDAGDYEVWYKVEDGINWTGITPARVTATIAQAAAIVESKPEATNYTYNGTAQALVTAGVAKNNIGTVVYSLDKEEGPYSSEIPVATNCYAHRVWYMIEGSKNWTKAAPASVTAAIAKADLIHDGEEFTVNFTSEQLTLSDIPLDSLNHNDEGAFAWLYGDTQPQDGVKYPAKFTPTDETNYNVATVEVKVILTDPPAAGGGTSGAASASSGANAANRQNTGSASVQTSVRGGTSSTVLTAAAGDGLVNDAVANQSKNIVIKPEITGDVTKAEVSLPASSVSRIKNETDAALTVSTPIADVTIPNAALDTLSGAGGAVSVVTEQVENTVVLTLAAGGRDIGSVPGGLTLTVPAENAGSGTVAVLVYADGTRETVRRSVLENGAVRIPLGGSATVEIVDNSKEFADVPADDWASDAVAFASAHELFNGTSETTFSPGAPMSRAMLATVLYNLEGCPDQSMTDNFTDVGSDAWYASSVSWAAANGIIGGYDDGQFGPDDNVTREQFVVMLWRYEGSPAADGQSLSLTDAEQASGYAVQALCWAAANGILRGYDDGRLYPGDMSTRSQAAQILKNYIENT